MIINKFKIEHILDIDMLNKYIEICLSRKTIKNSNTERHHILPKSLYPEYKNLNKHKFNSVYLTKQDHLLAHFILAKALHKDTNMKLAFKFMNERMNLNFKDLRLDSKLEDILDNKEFIKIRQEANILSDSHIKNIIKSNKTRVYSEETRKKISEGNKGKFITKETRKKISLTSKGRTHTEETKKEISNKLKGRKLSLEHIEKIKNRPLNKDRIKKMVETRNSKSRIYTIYCDSKIVKTNVLLKDIKKISQGLLKTTKEKPLGYNSYSKNRLNMNNNLHLIGYYIQEII